MGIAKNHWLEVEERGWRDPCTYVCQHCVQDPFLRGLVRKNLTDTRCMYCQSKTRKSAPLAVLMHAVLQAVKRSFNDFVNAGCPTDREISIECLSSDDVLVSVLHSEGIEWPEKLVLDVARAFGNDGWVDAPDGEWMGSHLNERLLWSWDTFAFEVKHKSRFNFQTKKKATTYGDDLIDIGEILPFLGQLVRKQQMVITVPQSAVFHRVRLGCHPLSDPEELGPPPREKSPAGRMNPIGIPYFYLAFDEATALAETSRDISSSVTISDWVLTRDARVVDLTALPPIPSVFDCAKKSKAELSIFLSRFSDEISKPVIRDGSEHIDYIPTQVVSEYLAQVFKSSNGLHLDGMIYPSAAISGGKNMVLFPARDRSFATRVSDRFDCVELKDAKVKPAGL